MKCCASGTFRSFWTDVYKRQERAIVEERVRLAMGLPTRRMDEHNSVVSGLEDASIADK